jgi:hypothetical protein
MIAARCSQMNTSIFFSHMLVAACLLICPPPTEISIPKNNKTDIEFIVPFIYAETVMGTTYTYTFQ